MVVRMKPADLAAQTVMGNRDLVRHETGKALAVPNVSKGSNLRRLQVGGLINNHAHNAKYAPKLRKGMK